MTRVPFDSALYNDKNRFIIFPGPSFLDLFFPTALFAKRGEKKLFYPRANVIGDLQAVGMWPGSECCSRYTCRQFRHQTWENVMSAQISTIKRTALCAFPNPQKLLLLPFIKQQATWGSLITKGGINFRVLFVSAFVKKKTRK